MKKFILFLLLFVASASAYAQTGMYSVKDDGYVRRYGGRYGKFYSQDDVLFVIYNHDNFAGATIVKNPVLVRFPQNKNVTTYTVPDDVMTIAKGAFKGNKYIHKVRIPSTITFIGEDAFEGCDNLTSIEVYESSSSIKSIEEDRNDIEREVIGRYNINGVKVEETDNGVQIILYSDGTADKILRK